MANSMDLADCPDFLESLSALSLCCGFVIGVTALVREAGSMPSRCKRNAPHDICEAGQKGMGTGG